MDGVMAKGKKRGNYRERKPVVPEEIRVAFLDHIRRDDELEMLLVFALWQAMVRRLFGVTLNCRDFEEAYRAWEIKPSRCQMITTAINTEDQLALMIRTMKPMPPKGDQCYDDDNDQLMDEETRQAA